LRGAQFHSRIFHSKVGTSPTWIQTWMHVALLSNSLAAMVKNMGALDRFFRTLAAAAVGILYATGVIGGTTALVLGVVAAAFVITSSVGTCPLYTPFGLSTRHGQTS
jgi:hypothetical protein